MVISNPRTLVLGLVYTSTIYNIVLRDVLLPHLDGHPLNNMLEDKYLWVMHMDIFTLIIN